MVSRCLAAALATVVSCVLTTVAFAQEPPAGSSTTPPATTSTGTQEAPPRPQGERPQERRGRGSRGRGARGRGGAPAEKKPRIGIPVNNAVVTQHCAGCHPIGDDGLMSRVSFMRKSPEGWELSMKRMIRMYDIRPTPAEAREMVRYLSHHLGLTRGEAERALYEAERRVHWSEAEQDSEIRQTCAPCHTLGRVFSQQRDADEWQHLKKMHLALYTASWGPFGERRNRSSRGGSSATGFAGFGGGQADGSTRGGATRGGSTRGGSTRGRGDASARGGRGGRGGSTPTTSQASGSRADRVLNNLAKTQPLMSDEWKAWQIDEREVPVAGMWTVVGHEVSRGPIRGTLEITRTDRDVYTTEWNLEFGDGARVRRKGRSVMYAGYSWRGRSRPEAGTSGKEPAQLREVLLLSADWNTFRGRCFTGAYNEIGMDVTAYRNTGSTQMFATDGPAIAPSKGTKIVVRGSGFPTDATARDFHLGAGITVTDVKRENNTKLTLMVDIAKDARLGKRRISFRAIRGPEIVTLYDTIDYVKITPAEGFSRVGGKAKIPKQNERFEAWGMHRGPDKKLYTKDDWQIKVVPATWRLEEFAVHEFDDDVKYIGAIDPKTGFFTPAIDGPNPKRRWNANNIGNVYVVAETKLTVPVRPPEPKKVPKEPVVAPAGEGGGPDNDNGAAGNGGPRAAVSDVTSQDPATPFATEEKAFKARGHLLVTVPLYIMWDRYQLDHE